MPRKKSRTEESPSPQSDPQIDQALVAKFTESMRDDPSSFAERVRPDGPRVRTSDDEHATYSGKDVRVTAQDDSYFVEMQRPLSDQVVDGDRIYLTAEKQDMLVAAGFDDISERGDASLWRASKRDVHRSGRDINVLAIELDSKGARLGWTR